MSELNIPVLMLREKMLFSGEIYTTGKNLTLPPAVTAGTNITSVCLGRSLSDNTFNNIKGCGCYGYYGSNEGRGSSRHGWIGGKVNHIAEELKMFYLGDQLLGVHPILSWGTNVKDL